MDLNYNVKCVVTVCIVSLRSWLIKSEVKVLFYIRSGQSQFIMWQRCVTVSFVGCLCLSLSCIHHPLSSVVVMSEKADMAERVEE